MVAKVYREKEKKDSKDTHPEVEEHPLQMITIRYQSNLLMSMRNYAFSDILVQTIEPSNIQVSPAKTHPSTVISASETVPRFITANFHQKDNSSSSSLVPKEATHIDSFF